ncbi:MAG: Ig domain protein group 1 domain protein, partial [Methanomicrobiales archaeon 53_19]
MLQKNKLSRNQKGFTLIELMVAVAILALAAFGIFQAYTVGFMGMADARDRTVATNYLQEAMEEIKNMDFEKIDTTSKVVYNENKRYRIDVNLVEASATLKKVFTVVSWIDRNGNTKTVDSSMSINFIEFFASEPAKIVLFAESYSILNTPVGSPYASTTIIAVIKDINGNTITDWGKNPGEGNVTFSIISIEQFGEFPGNLSEIVVTPIEGRASTTFTSTGFYSAAKAPTGDYFVLQEIQASVDLPEEDKTVTDTITIKISDGPVKIILNPPNPKSTKAGEGKYSTITASVIDAAGVVLPKNGIFNDIEITFNTIGEGKFEDGSSTYSVTIPYDSGSSDSASVTVDLFSTGTPGLVNILATSFNMESDATEVIFLGPPVAISISAYPNPIYEDEAAGSTIKVSLLDINGYATNPSDTSITISLSLINNETGGEIEDNNLIFEASDSEGVIQDTRFYNQTSTGTAIITASGGGLPEASVTISVISALVPDHIKLTADPQIVPADGISSSTIKAIVYDISGKIVTNYAGTITFNTSLGALSNFNFTNGIATTNLSSYTPGIATITVSSDSLPSNPSEGIIIKFYGEATHIKLEANPKNVKANGTDFSTIIATVCDVNNVTVMDYEGTVTFYTTLGTFTGSDTKNITNGIATIELSSTDPGTATVTTSSYLPSDPASGVEIVFYVETTLTLEPDTTHYEGTENKIITFNVRVNGENI